MWRVGTEGEWHQWFPAFQGKTPSDFLHLGARSDFNDCHSKNKKTKPVLTPQKMCNKWSTRQDDIEENGFQEQNCSFTLYEIQCALCGWNTLQAGHQEQTNLLVSEPHDGGERHDEHQIGLSNLFPATPLNPYSEPYFPGNHLFYRIILLWN